MCSVFGALNGNLLVGPRLLYAMGEDGLAPRALGSIHPRYQTPAAAIAVLTVWAVLLILVVAVLTASPILPVRTEQGDWKVGVPPLDPTKSHFDRLTDFAMFGAVIFETLAVTSIFVFRWRLPHVERPYRCPGYPVVPALYVVLPLFVLVNMFFAQPFEALTGLVFIALGALLYFAIGLQKSPAEPLSPPDARWDGSKPNGEAISNGPAGAEGQSPARSQDLTK